MIINFQDTYTYSMAKKSLKKFKYSGMCLMRSRCGIKRIQSLLNIEIQNRMRKRMGFRVNWGIITSHQNQDDREKLGTI